MEMISDKKLGSNRNGEEIPWRMQINFDDQLDVESEGDRES